MFVEQTRLFDRPLSLHLRERLTSQEATIMRQSDPDLLAPGLVEGHITPSAVPELLRKDTEFDTRESGDKVLVRVKVPVTGDVELLKCVPEGLDYLRIRAKITDDLERGADMNGNSYSSDTFNPPSPDRRSGFVLSKNFSGSTGANEIREWARELLDRFESYLSAMSDQVAAHEEHARSLLAERADARRRALMRASSLTDELGKGV